MIFTETPLKQAYIINPSPFCDQRGYFMRLFSKDEFKEIGFNKEFVQINQSMNKHRHTFRGFHYQVPPYGETKLIRCVSGRVQDYIIDIRKNSPTFLKSFTIELSEEFPQTILVPEGFAHGYITMEENSSLVYFHTAVHMPGLESGLRYDDPGLDIKLPVEPVIISNKDLSYLLIGESLFEGLEIED